MPLTKQEGSLRGVMANVLNCNIVVSEFELKSRYYVLYWTNTLGKPLISPAMGSIQPLLSFYPGNSGI